MFVGDKKMQQLNTAFRGISKTTDVLSFPQRSEKWEVRSKSKRPSAKTRIGKSKKSKKTETPFTFQFTPPTSHFLLGDIVVSVPAAETQAEMRGVDFYDEIYRLLIHSVLHLLGYEHEKSSSRTRAMRKKEEELLNAIKKMG